MDERHARAFERMGCPLIPASKITADEWEIGRQFYDAWAAGRHVSEGLGRFLELPKEQQPGVSCAFYYLRYPEGSA